MNSSYDEVLRQSTSTWIFQRVELVLEFSRKQITPVPLNIIPTLLLALKLLFVLPCSWIRRCPAQSSEYKHKSDLEQLQECFGNGVADFVDMYRDDDQMASLYHDLYGEYCWVRNHFEKGANEEKTSHESRTKKADYMRSCAELVKDMCSKRMSQELDQFANMQCLIPNAEYYSSKFDIDDAQSMPISLKEHIWGKVQYIKERGRTKPMDIDMHYMKENASQKAVSRDVDVLENHISSVIETNFDSLCRKVMPPAKMRRVTPLLPLPHGPSSV